MKRLPAFLKPNRWPVVGRAFQAIHESPADNGCTSLVLLCVSMLAWAIGLSVSGSMGIGALYAVPFVAWSLGHFIAMMVMLRKIKKARKEREKKLRKEGLAKRGITIE